MKDFIIQAITFLIILFFSKSLEEANYYYYPVEHVFQYLEYQALEDSEYQNIINNLRKILYNSYAFYDISKNPPQPSRNYHTIVDIDKRLKEINPQDINSLDFYRMVYSVLSDLKDSHIRLFMNDFDFSEFFILGPFDYTIKEYEGKQRMFAECINNEVLELFEDVNQVGIAEFCFDIDNKPIKSINNKDPFDYLNNFGGNYVSTKNAHGTFSFKMKFHNDVSLRDYPLTYEELTNLQIIFDDEAKTNITTSYLLKSYLNIYNRENYLRSLRNGKGFYAGKFFKEGKYANKNNIKIKRELHKNNKKLRNLSTYIPWNYEVEDSFKCYCDEDNKINIYYVMSFSPKDRSIFYNTIVKCVELFDKNTYPIVVVNDLNTGGYLSLSQLFMGILSPLVPISLYKGRLRITDGLKETKEISEFINANLTNIYNCEKMNYTDLINEKVKTNYSETLLSQMFYINNKTIHNQIEVIRANMKNKRKPTEILILTDGYSFSSASLYIKYLQKMGGAIIAGYNGNPYNNEIFDSSQSPSALFTSDYLTVFNPIESQSLKENNIEFEIPGIQTFYNLDDKNVPLEYEITPVDIRLDFYQDFSDETYSLFIEQSLKILEDIENNCYSLHMIKFDKECDKFFKKAYKHGGYICNEDGTWSNVCVEAYCDMGYIFNQKEKKCIKDVCSSIPIDEDDEEEKDDEEEDNEEEEDNKDHDEDDKKNESSINNYRVFLFIFAIILFF